MRYLIWVVFWMLTTISFKEFSLVPVMFDKASQSFHTSQRIWQNNEMGLNVIVKQQFFLSNFWFLKHIARVCVTTCCTVAVNDPMYHIIIPIDWTIIFSLFSKNQFANIFNGHHFQDLSLLLTIQSSISLLWWWPSGPTRTWQSVQHSKSVLKWNCRLLDTLLSTLYSICCLLISCCVLLSFANQRYTGVIW